MATESEIVKASYNEMLRAARAKRNDAVDVANQEERCANERALRWVREQGFEYRDGEFVRVDKG